MEALKRPADGYTLLSVGTPFAAVPALVPDAKFKVETDLAPLVQIGTAYNVLVVNPSVPANSVSELIAYLKKDPGKHTFSSGGFGTPAHLLGELFKLETGVQTTHVPYVQFPQAIADLISGVNTYQFIAMMPVVQHINTGKLRALAVMGRKRVAALKDVPTIIEAGYPKLQSPFWLGVVAPAGTPPEIINKLNAAFRESLTPPETRARLDMLGADIKIGTPAEFEKMLADDLAQWIAIVKAANIKAQ